MREKWSEIMLIKLSTTEDPEESWESEKKECESCKDEGEREGMEEKEKRM